MNDSAWNHAVFSKNRERLLAGEIAAEFFTCIVEQARALKLLSDEHFTVDGTLIQAWASHKSFRPKDGSDEDGEGGFRGKKRSNETHSSTTDPESHRDRTTLGADKGYDTQDFVKGLRELGVTPHVAKNTSGRRSRIDGRTTRHAGYAASQKKRKLVEQIFGWMKTTAVLRQTRHRGRQKVAWMFTFAAAAYNLVRIRNLMEATA